MWNANNSSIFLVDCCHSLQMQNERWIEIKIKIKTKVTVLWLYGLGYKIKRSIVNKAYFMCTLMFKVAKWEFKQNRAEHKIGTQAYIAPRCSQMNCAFCDATNSTDKYIRPIFGKWKQKWLFLWLFYFNLLFRLFRYTNGCTQFLLCCIVDLVVGDFMRNHQIKLVNRNIRCQPCQRLDARIWMMTCALRCGRSFYSTTCIWSSNKYYFHLRCTFQE